MKQQKSVFTIYQGYLESGQLAYQFSPKAGMPLFYPREVCPYTGSIALEWRVSKGIGTVYSTTVVHRRGESPYNVSLIDMEEGFRLMSKVVGTPSAQVQIGAAVRFSDVGQDDGMLFPIFTLDSESMQ